MKIELRNVKHAAFASQETECFTASIFIDGEKAGEVSNEGQGGSDNFRPWALEKTLDEYAKTLPQYDASDLYGKPPGTEMADHSAETLIGELLNEWLVTKDLKRRIGKKMLFTVKGKKGIFAVSFKQPGALPKVLADKAMLATFAHRHQTETILNTLPFDEALKIFRESA